MIKVKFSGNLMREIELAAAGQVEKKREEMVAKLRAATPVDTGEARAGWQIAGNAIVNDVDHISNLNEGTSKQAPARFIERTLLQEPGVVPNGIIVTNTR